MGNHACHSHYQTAQRDEGKPKAVDFMDGEQTRRRPPETVEGCGGQEVECRAQEERGGPGGGERDKGEREAGGKEEQHCTRWEPDGNSLVHLRNEMEAVRDKTDETKEWNQVVTPQRQRVRKTVRFDLSSDS